MSLVLLSLVAAVLTLLAMMYPFEWRSGDAPEVTWLVLADTTVIHLFWMALLFVPYGFVECWVGINLFRQGWLVTVMVAIDAAVLALLGESAQLWIDGQTSSIIDLIAHVIGALLGSMIAFSLVDWWWQGKPKNLPPRRDSSGKDDDDASYRFDDDRE